MRPLLHLGPNVITDRTFFTLGFKMSLQMAPLLHLGPVITQSLPQSPSEARVLKNDTEISSTDGEQMKKRK